MVAPIVGPINSFTYNTPTRYKRAEKWKQAKPYSEPLEYFGRDFTGSHVNGGTIALDTFANYWEPETNPAAALNVSYAKLVDRIGSSSELGTTLAEFRQSASMIQNRATQLWSAARKIRSFRFSEAARILRQSTVPKGASTKKSFANNWLEFSFGWSPLIQDIYASVDVLQSRQPKFRISGKGLDHGSYNYFYRYEFPGVPEWTVENRTSGEWLITVRQGCTLGVSNPNLYLANQLGLVNPLTIGWELVPFSFVVDWFIPVGQFLSQGTDFLGLTVSRPWRMHHALVSGYDYSYNYYNGTRITTMRGARMRRFTSLSGIQLVPRPWKVPHWRRAANAVSLLVQILSKR